MLQGLLHICLESFVLQWRPISEAHVGPDIQPSSDQSLALALALALTLALALALVTFVGKVPPCLRPPNVSLAAVLHRKDSTARPEMLTGCTGRHQRFA